MAGGAAARAVAADGRPFRESLLAMIGVALVLMLSALDQTVIGNALPVIVADLQGFSMYAWIASGYLLASVVTIPVFGRLGDTYGRKRFVVLATLVFAAGSLVCALAPAIGWLVAGRVLQGVGGGILIGTAFACVPELFPDTRQRLRWQMLLSALFSVVNATGPTLGGWLTELYGWRAVFYLNLPLAAVALYFVLRHLPAIRPPQAGEHRMDWTGAALMAVALASLQLLVASLGGPGAGLRAAGLAALSLAAWLALWRWQRRCRQPLLPLVLFADRSLRLTLLLSVIAGAVMFVLLFYMPLLLQGVYAYGPREAGLLVTPLVLCITVGAIANGRIVARIDNPNWLPRLGFALLLLCFAGLYASGRGASFGMLLLLMFCGGTGLGLTLMNLTLFTQTLAPRAHLGIATALVQALRLVGGMLGTAAVGSLVNLSYHLGVDRRLAEWGVPPSLHARFADPRWLLDADDRAQAASGLRLAGMDADAVVGSLREALTQAIGHAMLLGGMLAAVALYLACRLPRVDLMARRA